MAMEGGMVDLGDPHPAGRRTLDVNKTLYLVT